MKNITLRDIKKNCLEVVGRGVTGPRTRDNPVWCRFKIASAILDVIRHKESRS